MPSNDELLAQVQTLTSELDKRTRRHEKVEPYFETSGGQTPIPAAVSAAGLTNAYQQLMAMSEMPWGKVIVNSKLDRLEVTGIQSETKAVDDAVWGVWQDEAMDLESRLAHSSTLLDGRAHALVWPRDGRPRISLDDATQMVVQYEEGRAGDVSPRCAGGRTARSRTPRSTVRRRSTSTSPRASTRRSLGRSGSAVTSRASRGRSTIRSGSCRSLSLP